MMISFLKKIALRAGEICLARAGSLSNQDIDFKSAKDIVTNVDREVERFLIDEVRLRFPDHKIIGEETGESGVDDSVSWIIDPIDGTTSYFHGQPYYSISIAVKEQGRLSHGVVYAPAMNEMYVASRGTGAFLNGKRIVVSGADKLINSVLSTGFTCLRSGLEDNNLKYFNKILLDIRDFRRGGSAALDLASVASGRLDGYWEMNLNEYDVAAGVLLVKEAGGHVCDFTGGASFPQFGVVAGNQAIVQHLLPYFTTR